MVLNHSGGYDVLIDPFIIQGSIFSAIGRGIEAIIGAIASVCLAIVGAITTVRFSLFHLFSLYNNLFFQGYRNHLRRDRRYFVLQMLWLTESRI